MMLLWPAPDPKKTCVGSHTFSGSLELKLSGIEDLIRTPKLQSFSSKLPVKVCELAHDFFDLNHSGASGAGNSSIKKRSYIHRTALIKVEHFS